MNTEFSKKNISEKFKLIKELKQSLDSNCEKMFESLILKNKLILDFFYWWGGEGGYRQANLLLFTVHVKDIFFIICLFKRIFKMYTYFLKSSMN